MLTNNKELETSTCGADKSHRLKPFMFSLTRINVTFIIIFLYHIINSVMPFNIYSHLCNNNLNVKILKHRLILIL